MNVRWTAQAWDDYLHWQQTDPALLAKVNELIRDIKRSGAARGLGKPEALKYDLAGWWSRRITREHRLVYRVTGQGRDQQIEIIQCRYHY